MRAREIIELMSARLYISLKGIFLMATGMCLLAGGVFAYPLVYVAIERVQTSHFDWLPPVILIVCFVWSVVFLYKGVKVLKEGGKNGK